MVTQDMGSGTSLGSAWLRDRAWPRSCCCSTLLVRLHSDTAQHHTHIDKTSRQVCRERNIGQSVQLVRITHCWVAGWVPCSGGTGACAAEPGAGTSGRSCGLQTKTRIHTHTSGLSERMSECFGVS